MIGRRARQELSDLTDVYMQLIDAGVDSQDRTELLQLLARRMKQLLTPKRRKV